MHRNQALWLNLAILMSFFTSHAFSQADGLKELMEVREQLDQIAPQHIQSGFLLNKGFFVSGNLDLMRQIEPGNEEKNFIKLTSSQWQDYYRRMQVSQTRTTLPTADYWEVIHGYRNTDHTVPIGILMATGELLDEQQVAQALTADEPIRRRRAYEKITVFAGAALKRTVEGLTVTYVLDEALFAIPNGMQNKVSISLGDGEGYRRVTPGMRIKSAYDTPGTKIITVTYDTPKGEVRSYSMVEVLPPLPAADEDFTVTAPGKPGAAARDIAGGTAKIHYAGCDRILNKPIIIVEGFDPLNSFTNGEINGKYFSVLSPLRASGYDIISLNFNDGAASIETNAAVLEETLARVRAMQQGNHPIAIIGESMGGLVTRYCLADMEQRGLSHHVNLFIAFDSPFKGANVPPAYQKLLEMADDNYIQNLFNIAQQDLDVVQGVLNSPAAKQMLLRWRGPNPHPDFVALQNKFAQLGWPQQCRNVAIVNGSSVGDNQGPVGNFDPGDRLITGTGITVLYNSVVTTRANGLNTNTTVASLQLYQGVIPMLLKSSRDNYGPMCYDMVPGGFFEPLQGAEVTLASEFWENIFQALLDNAINDNDRPHFTFVPLFSALASTGPLDTQARISRSINDIEANNLTPFDEVYSNSDNTLHVTLALLNTPWTNLVNNEFTSTTFCPAGVMNPAPHPTFRGPTTICSQIGGYGKYVLLDDNPTGLDGTFQHAWQLKNSLGSPIASGTGSSFEVFGFQYSPGLYTVEVTRSYTNQFNGTSTTYTWPLEILTGNDSRCSSSGCDFGSPDDPCLQRTTAQAYPNPADHRLTVPLRPTARLKSISLINPSQPSGAHTVSVSWELSATNQVEIPIEHLAAGLYVLKIQYDDTIAHQRIIIKH